MFISLPRRTDQHYVATIGGAQNSVEGMGTTLWRWKDDSGQHHTIDVENVLYFPQSPVNILSITSLADQFNDDDGTGINTKRRKSHFYWNHNKHQRTITHPQSNFLELPFIEGFSLAGIYTQMVGAKVFTSKQHCHFHASNLISNDENPSLTGNCGKFDGG